VPAFAYRFLVPEATFEGLPLWKCKSFASPNFRGSLGYLFENPRVAEIQDARGWPRCNIRYARSSLDRTAGFRTLPTGGPYVTVDGLLYFL
jgi:hypothetical protein